MGSQNFLGLLRRVTGGLGCLKLDHKLVKPNEVIPKDTHQDVLRGLLKNGLLTPGGFDAMPKGGAP